MATDIIARGLASKANKSIEGIQVGGSPYVGDDGNWYVWDSSTSAYKDSNIKAQGVKGDPGRGIVSIERTSGTGEAGTTDTYTITYTDDTTSTYEVYNGKDGKDGENGTDGTNGTDGITPHIGENGNWYIGDVDTGISATGYATVPVASDTTLGGIKVGKNLTIEQDGTLNAQAGGSTEDVIVYYKALADYTDDEKLEIGKLLASCLDSDRNIVKICYCKYNSQLVQLQRLSMTTYNTNFIFYSRNNTGSISIRMGINTGDNPTVSRSELTTTDLVDDQLSSISKNPVQNKVVTSAFNERIKVITDPVYFVDGTDPYDENGSSDYPDGYYIFKGGIYVNNELCRQISGEINGIPAPMVYIGNTFAKFFITDVSPIYDDLTHTPNLLIPKRTYIYYERNTEKWYPTDSGNVIVTKAALEDNVLSKTNTTEYTPTNDYNPATKLYVDNSSINYIGRETQIGFNATLSGNIITGELDESISDFELINSTGYLINLHLPITTLTGVLDDNLQIVLKDKDGNTINLHTVYQDEGLEETATVGNMCQIQEYNINTGYTWNFYAHYSQVTDNGTVYRTMITDTIVRETNTSMTGTALHQAILNAMLAPNTTVMCTEDYSMNGTIFTKGHTYKITGTWEQNELILNYEDITALGTDSSDSVIITFKNFSDYTEEEKTNIANKLLSCVDNNNSLVKICYLDAENVYYQLSAISQDENNLLFTFQAQEGTIKIEVVYSISKDTKVLTNVASTTKAVFDAEMSSTSTNAVQNKVVKAYIDSITPGGASVSSVNVTISTSSWTEDTTIDGYTHKAEVDVTGVTENNHLIVGMQPTATLSQDNACAESDVKCGGQAEGKIYMYSTSVPIVDLPMVVTILG